jgi:putative methionine-R-sulfoxide reductase with GAF domain
MDFAPVLDEIRTIITRMPREAPAEVVEVLHNKVPRYDWVGTYWVQGRDLLLGPWKGPAGGVGDQLLRRTEEDRSGAERGAAAGAPRL